MTHPTSYRASPQRPINSHDRTTPVPPGQEKENPRFPGETTKQPGDQSTSPPNIRRHIHRATTNQSESTHPPDHTRYKSPWDTNTASFQQNLTPAAHATGTYRPGQKPWGPTNKEHLHRESFAKTPANILIHKLPESQIQIVYCLTTTQATTTCHHYDSSLQDLP